MLVVCPTCQQNYDVEEVFVGENIECQQCDTNFLIEIAKEIEETKICSECGEVIKKIAKKCRHCKANLWCLENRKTLLEKHPEFASCKFLNPPPSFKQFAYALSLGIDPHGLSFETISYKIDYAVKNELRAEKYVLEDDKEELYEYIFHQNRAVKSKKVVKFTDNNINNKSPELLTIRKKWIIALVCYSILFIIAMFGGENNMATPFLITGSFGLNIYAIIDSFKNKNILGGILYILFILFCPITSLVYLIKKIS